MEVESALTMVRKFRAMRFESGTRQITGKVARAMCRSWIAYYKEKYSFESQTTPLHRRGGIMNTITSRR